MTRTKSRVSQRNTTIRLKIIVWSAFALGSLWMALLPSPTQAQAVAGASGFRIGERLTYSISLGRFPNAGYAELYCVSRGRLGEKDAVELRSKFKTLDLASAVYPVDENRTTFVSSLSGLPLYTSVVQNSFGLPKETVQSFLSAPTPHADLLMMIYHLRHSDGTGSLTMQEGEKVYSVTFQPGAAERQKTDAGEFDTTIVSVQSEYFIEHGMSDVRVNLSTDEARLPVLIRYRTGKEKEKDKDKDRKGEVRARLASVQMIEPEVAPQPTPIAARTPQPDRTPKPVVTPTPYIDNLPLVPELAFELGERLEYKITSAGQPVAKMIVAVKERKQFNGVDSLVLEATFSDVRGASPFAVGDFVRAYVNPETLAPRQFEMRFSGALRAFSSTAKFDPAGSSVTVGATRVEAPVGTHTILSLLFAARSFNLKPSRDLNNPINDTRVAVLWESQPYIFTLRPSPAEVITLAGGQPTAAQLVTVTTKNTLLDQMGIKVWLGNDDSRVPLRFVMGAYQADLIGVSKVLPN
ncbi:MAG TPA: DUF3108 domain-containing protein [Pyrinomonadaceae bacterium]|nr:DUF3108 domain-containing protein [Pyrinomonadaceae bacterium]